MVPKSHALSMVHLVQTFYHREEQTSSTSRHTPESVNTGNSTSYNHSCLVLDTCWLVFVDIHRSQSIQRAQSKSVTKVGGSVMGVGGAKMLEGKSAVTIGKMASYGEFSCRRRRRLG